MWPLLLVVAAGVVFWTRHTYAQTHPTVKPSLLRILTSLRVVALLLLLLAIAGPVISIVQTQNKPAEILVLLEDSGSMSIEDAGLEQISRWDFSLAALQVLKDAFARTGGSVKLTLVRGNGLNPGREFNLDDPVISTAESHGTDLGRFVAEQTKGNHWDVAATVVISDGQQTVANGKVQDVPGKNRASDAPVFVVGVGDPDGSVDRLITDLRYPDTAYAGDEIVVQLAVAHRFTKESDLGDMVVRLVGESGELARKVISPESSVQALELQFVPEQEGMQVLELEVSPLDNERFQSNNKVSLAIDVQKSRTRVLLLSEFPGWDVRFLAQAAVMEPRVDLQVVYAAAGGLVFAENQEPWPRPQNSVQWLEWDAVILTSWSGKLGRLHWDGLANAVDQGLGLLVFPGGGIKSPRVRPLTILPPALKDLIPVSNTRWAWQEGTFFLNDDGNLQGHPVLAGVSMGAPGSRQALHLEDLPPLPGVIDTKVKEGALGLVWGEQRPASTAAEVARTPVLVVDRHGKGPVAWLAGRRFWETAFWNQDSEGLGDGALDGQPIVRLLRNLLVWVSAGAQENGLAFSGHRSIFQAGERITLAAQWRDLRGQPFFDKPMYLLLEQVNGLSDEGSRSFSFGTMDPQSGIAVVELPALPPGRYSVQLQGAGNPPLNGPEAELTVLDHSVEDTQVSMDRRSLVQFNSSLGGTFYELSDDDAVTRLVADIQKLPLKEAVDVKRRRYDFWSRWPFLVLVSSLLGFEWFLRRRNGML